MGRSPTPDDILSKVLVEKGYLTQPQLEACQKAYRDALKTGVRIAFLKFVQDRGHLDDAKVALIREELARRGVHPKLGEYEILGKIGEGGMGTVFKAKHPRLGTEVAIKVLRPEVAENELVVKRFEREGKMASKLHGADIVQVLDVQRAEGKYFIVMEYMDGESVEDRIQREGKLPEIEALRIIRDAACALDHAHKAGIVHRDMKPSNLMLSKAGKVKIADLGLGKDKSAGDSSLTDSGTGMGTPHYVSPEEASDSKHVDHRTDIYSLGASLYHMVTGSTPYEGSSGFKVVLKHLNEPLRDPREVNPALSTETAGLIRQMMEKDPAKRIQNCEAVAQAAERIHRMLEDREALAAPKKLLGLPRKVAVAVGLGAAALVAVGLFALLGRGDGKPPAVATVTRATVVPAQTPTTTQAAVATAPAVTTTTTPAKLGEPKSQPPAKPVPTTMPASAPPPSEPTPIVGIEEPVLPVVDTKESGAPQALFTKFAVQPVGTPLDCPPNSLKAPPVDAPLFTAPPLPERFTTEVFEAAPNISYGLALEGTKTWWTTGAGVFCYETSSKKWSRLDMRHGFPCPFVRGVAVDGQGRKWFGSYGHLISLDDHTLTVWSCPDVGMTFVSQMAVDAKGRLCVVSRKGLHVFTGDQFETIPLAQGAVPDCRFRSLAISPDGVAYALLATALCIFDLEAKTCRTVPLPTGWEAADYASAGAESRSRCWFAIRAGAPRTLSQLWLLENDRFQLLPSKPGVAGPIVGNARDGFFVADQGVYRITRTGTVDIVSGKPGVAPWNMDATSAIRDAAGRVFLTSSGSHGLWMIDRGTVTFLAPGAAIPGYLTGVTVDALGGVWGSTMRGLCRYDGKTWRVYDRKSVPAFSANDGFYAVRAGAGGVVYAAAATAVCSFNRGAWNRLATIPNGNDCSLAQTPDGTIWLGGYSSGISTISGGQVRTWTMKEGLLANGVRLAADSKSSRVWAVPRVGTGLQLYDGARWTTVARDTGTTGRGAVTVAVDAAGNPWVGCVGRVTQYDLAGSRTAEAKFPWDADTTKAVVFDPQGRLWVGAEQSGAACFDGSRWRRFTALNGLICNSVRDFAFAPDGSVWVASAGGVSHIVFGKGPATPAPPADANP